MLKNVVYYDIEQQNVFRAMYMCFGFVLFFKIPTCYVHIMKVLFVDSGYSKWVTLLSDYFPVHGANKGIQHLKNKQIAATT